MKKMPTLFERQFENHKIIKCLNKVHKECEWVINGEGYATEKLDGTCCMVKDNKLYRRYDYKEGRTLPIFILHKTLIIQTRKFGIRIMIKPKKETIIKSFLFWCIPRLKNR